MTESEENVITHAEDENAGAVENTQKTVKTAGKILLGALAATVVAEVIDLKKKKK